MQEFLATFSFSLFKKTKCILQAFGVKISYVGIKAKLFIIKNWFLGVVLVILDYAQHHLVDFWKKRLTNFNFLSLEWNSYNSSIQFHIVWLRSSFFNLECSVDRGCGVKKTSEFENLTFDIRAADISKLPKFLWQLKANQLDCY